MQDNGFINKNRLRGVAEEMPLDLMGFFLSGGDDSKNENVVQKVIFEN
jgi:hypothetical protein